MRKYIVIIALFLLPVLCAAQDNKTPEQRETARQSAHSDAATKIASIIRITQ